MGREGEKSVPADILSSFGSFLSLKVRNTLAWNSKGGAAEQEEEADHKTWNLQEAWSL